MAKANKAQAADSTAPQEGADAQADAVNEIKEQTMSETAPAVPSVEFAGTSIPVDSFFVTPVDRDIELDYGGNPVVFMFKAGEPRQLPPGVIGQALGVGVQVAG